MRLKSGRLHSTLSPPGKLHACLCSEIPRTARPRRFAGDDAHRLRLRRRRRLCRPAALQPARAQQRVRQAGNAGGAIAEAHAGKQAVLRGQQRPAAQRQGAHLPRRHGAGRRAEARRADHGRPRPDRPGARNWPEMPVHLSVQANTVNFRRGALLAEAGRHAHHPVARAVARRSRRDPPGMPGHRTRSLRARRAVHRLLGALPALRLLQPPRPQPGHLHQLLPLGLQGQAGEEDAGDVRDRTSGRSAASDRSGCSKSRSAPAN
jgi:hypothetical protein